VRASAHMADGGTLLSQGSGRKRRMKSRTVIQSGLHSSHAATARAPSKSVADSAAVRNAEPRSPRARTNREMLQALEDGAAAGRDTADGGGGSARGGAGRQPRPPSKPREVEGFPGFGQLDDVLGRLLRQKKVGEALQYLQKLQGMIEAICLQLEPRLPGGGGSSLLPNISPRGALPQPGALGGHERVRPGLLDGGGPGGAPSLQSTYAEPEDEAVENARTDAQWKERRLKKLEVRAFSGK
jgi:hypothetical protein